MGHETQKCSQRAHLKGYNKVKKVWRPKQTTAPHSSSRKEIIAAQPAAQVIEGSEQGGQDQDLSKIGNHQLQEDTNDDKQGTDLRDSHQAADQVQRGKEDASPQMPNEQNTPFITVRRRQRSSVKYAQPEQTMPTSNNFENGSNEEGRNGKNHDGKGNDNHDLDGQHCSMEC